MLKFACLYDVCKHLRTSAKTPSYSRFSKNAKFKTDITLLFQIIWWMCKNESLSTHWLLPNAKGKSEIEQWITKLCSFQFDKISITGKSAFFMTSLETVVVITPSWKISSFMRTTFIFPNLKSEWRYHVCKNCKTFVKTTRLRPNLVKILVEILAVFQIWDAITFLFEKINQNVLYYKVVALLASYQMQKKILKLNEK